eukprot:7681662-Prorocentrum_lima.AAC.1
MTGDAAMDDMVRQVQRQIQDGGVYHWADPQPKRLPRAAPAQEAANPFAAQPVAEVVPEPGPAS